MCLAGAPVTFVGVELHCDVEQTSWCMHPDQIQKKLEQEMKRKRVLTRDPYKEAAESRDHKPSPEEKKLQQIKEIILKSQDEIQEFRRNVKPVRHVKADELPKWMKPT